MNESELKRTDYNTDSPLDLCYNCMSISTNAALAFEGGGVISEEDNVDLSALGFDISNN
tara:strand:- start:979 stop:1155 length:177 start_codon:yes stop_codon:yes gene_type:complete